MTTLAFVAVFAAGMVVGLWGWLRIFDIARRLAFDLGSAVRRIEEMEREQFTASVNTTRGCLEKVQPLLLKDFDAGVKAGTNGGAQ